MSAERRARYRAGDTARAQGRLRASPASSPERQGHGDEAELVRPRLAALAPSRWSRAARAHPLTVLALAAGWTRARRTAHPHPESRAAAD